jgi:AhpD family alkylhydroperoxidase
MFAMPDQTPRIAPLPESEWDETVAGVVSVTGPLNIFTTLGRHPDLFKSWIGFGTMLLIEGTLPARDRELAILRAAHNNGCTYEWTHHARLAHQAGLDDAEIAALTAGLDEHSWAPADRAVVAAADELHTTRTLSQASWEALSARFDERGMIELVILVGHYTMLAFALNALRVQPEHKH